MAPGNRPVEYIIIITPYSLIHNRVSFNRQHCVSVCLCRYSIVKPYRGPNKPCINRVLPKTESVNTATIIIILPTAVMSLMKIRIDKVHKCRYCCLIKSTI